MDTLDLNQNRRIVDMSNRIALLDPNAGPFITLLKRMKKVKAGNPQFRWLEAEAQPAFTAVADDYDATDTDITITAGDSVWFRPGDLLRNSATGEVVRVVLVDAQTDTLTIDRGFGETTADDMGNGEELIYLGSANAEGAGAPDYRNTVTTDQFNYTQIFRTVAKISKTREKSDLYGGPDRAFQRKMKGIEHLAAINRAFMFGERAQDVTGTEPIRTTRGLVNWIQTNTDDAQGNLTEPGFLDFLEMAFDKGSSEKWALCSPSAMSAITGFATNMLVTRPADESYGLNIRQYVSPFGVLNLVLDKETMRGDVWGSAMVVVDLGNVVYRYLKDRDTKLITDIQANDEDAVADEYLTEAGLECRLEQTHALLVGI